MRLKFDLKYCLWISTLRSFTISYFPPPIWLDSNLIILSHQAMPGLDFDLNANVHTHITCIGESSTKIHAGPATPPCPSLSCSMTRGGINQSDCQACCCSSS